MVESFFFCVVLRQVSQRKSHVKAPKAFAASFACGSAEMWRGGTRSHVRVLEVFARSLLILSDDNIVSNRESLCETRGGQIFARLCWTSDMAPRV